MMIYIKLNLKRLDFESHYNQSQKSMGLEVGYKNLQNIRLPEKQFKPFLNATKKRH